jgi:hypothetical protein
VFSKPLVANRYDNIIDQLERKYYCGSVIKSNEDEESESEDSQPAPETTSAQAKASKGKKRNLCTDDYDMDDPFIDDEEMIYEVEAAIKTNRTKTKHDGFFVSSGKLEVMSPKKMQKVNASKATAKVPAAAANAPAPTQEQTTAAEEGKEALPSSSTTAAMTTDSKEVKKRKRRTKKELEEAALLKEAKKAAAAAASLSPASIAARSATPHLTALSNLTTAFSSAATASTLALPALGASVGATATSPEGAESAKAPGEAAAGASVPKVKAEKDVWQPNDAVLRAVQEFGEHVAGTGIKLAKSSNIPKSLEEALQKVDSAVLAHISADILGRTTGYYEALQAAMGGEIPAGKIRSAMVRLRLRERAEKTLEGIEAEIRGLMGDLKASLAPCPEKLQPSFKAAKKEKAQAQGKAGEVAGGSPQGAGTSGAGDGEVQQEGGTHLADLQADSAPHGESAPVVVQEGTPAAVTGVVTVGGKTAGGSDAAPVLMRYEWVCNWTRPMKIALCQIEQNLKLWVVQENQYREKLTVHDKKYMEEADVRPSCTCISRCFRSDNVVLRI